MEKCPKIVKRACILNRHLRYLVLNTSLKPNQYFFPFTSDLELLMAENKRNVSKKFALNLDLGLMFILILGITLHICGSRSEVWKKKIALTSEWYLIRFRKAKIGCHTIFPRYLASCNFMSTEKKLYMNLNGNCK